MKKHIFMSLILVATMPLVACTLSPDHGSHDEKSTSSATSAHVEGYPIDRTLAGLSGWGDLDAVVAIDTASLVQGKPVDLNESPDGFAAIVTPQSGTISEVLLGSLEPGSTVVIPLAGGSIDGFTLTASREFAPDNKELKSAGAILVAGSIVNTRELGDVLDPLFVYSISSDGIYTSLLESGSNEPYPSFTSDELTKALSLRK